jgi:surface protein
VFVVGLVFLLFVAPVSLLAVFKQASAFNQDVSKWITSSVTTMLGSKCTRSLSLFVATAPSVVGYTCIVLCFHLIIRLCCCHVYGCYMYLLSKFVCLYPFSSPKPVFRDSGFKRTLCGGKWQSLSSNSYLTSTGRLGCCPIGSFMSNPFVVLGYILRVCEKGAQRGRLGFGHRWRRIITKSGVRLDCWGDIKKYGGCDVRSN